MSEDELNFVKKMEAAFQKSEASHRKAKSFLWKTVGVLIGCLLILGTTNIAGVSSNKAGIVALEKNDARQEECLRLQKLQFELAKKDFVNNFTANRLIQSFVVQTDIMLKIGNKEIKTIEEVNRLFDKFRLDALQDGDTYTKRSGEPVKK